ncbi:MAG: IS5 family transposase [Treponematales bacterium]
MRQEKSWEITDEFWETAEPLVPLESRKALEAVFSVLRAGVRWNAIPKEKGRYSGNG